MTDTPDSSSPVSEEPPTQDSTELSREDFLWSVFLSMTAAGKIKVQASEKRTPNQQKEGGDTIFLPVPKDIIRDKEWIPAKETGDYPDLWVDTKLEKTGEDVGLSKTMFLPVHLRFLLHAGIATTTPKKPK